MAYDKQEPEVEETDDLRSQREAIKKWTKRIRDARKEWDHDFCRLRDNMEFASGYQWHDQQAIDDDRYIANQVNPLVNQKVSLLYARDPKAEAHRRKRLDFQVWDGRMESLQMAMTNPMDPVNMALMMDYTAGRQRRDLLDRIGRTLEIVYKWQLDNQAPSFKLQMKQLVRRVVTCGVGYVKLGFSRQFESQLTSDGPDNSIASRLKTIECNAEELSEGESTENTPVLEETRMLANSIAASAAAGDLADVDERLVIDFPSATSIIVDRNCRALKGFLGAQWIAQQYILPISTVNEFFETQVEVGGDLVLYAENGLEMGAGNMPPTSPEQPKEKLVCVFEVFDYNTKSHFHICDGWKDYLKEPAAVAPQTKRFWPIFALTFNDIETEPGQRATIYPPSDVQLVKSPQKEWNRTREALRKHRKANAPMYLTGASWLTEEDKERLRCHPDNAVIELQGAPAGTDVGNMLKPFEHKPIDPLVYNVEPLLQDLRVTLGNQEGALPASSKSTATAATINEQQRITTTSSNVDDLDDLLSDLAEASSEILLRELSPDTAKRIAGPGAVWPEAQREDFINEIFLGVQAASSGRPNKAIEVANFQQLAPILLQAGASPHFIIREGIRRLDDRLDPDEAFPLGPGVGAAVPATPPPSGGMAPTAQNQNPASHIKQPDVQRPDNVQQPQVPG